MPVLQEKPLGDAVRNIRRSSLVLPRKLYDREKEMAILLARFRAVQLETGEMEFVLITGASGTGKTALARALEEHVKPGSFLITKFDQQHSNTNTLTVFGAALSSYIEGLLERQPDRIEILRGQIHEVTAGDPRLLVQTIPSLKKIFVDTQYSDHGSAPFGSNTQAASYQLLCDFLAVLCSFESSPIVLVIDDLHWASKESVDLLEKLLTSIVRNIMVIGTCRGNEMLLDDELSIMLRKVEDDGLRIVEIPLQNLSKNAVQRMVEESTDLEPEICHAIAGLLCTRTGGNVFFAIHLLQCIIREGIPQESSEELKLNLLSTDPVALLRYEIERLPEPLPYLLKVAACLGNSVDRALLRTCVDIKEEIFDIAEDANLLVAKDSNTYMFTHDKVQEASYGLIPEPLRPRFHLEIARNLLKGLSRESVGSEVVTIASQLSRCLPLIKEDEERILCASILYDAGKEAAEASSFSTASLYMKMGRSLLPMLHWGEHYDLSLQLFSSSAEVEYVNGNLDESDLLIDEVLLHAKTLSDKLSVYSTRLYALGTQSRFKECLNIAFDLLKSLHERFPRRISKIHIAFELAKTQHLLRRLQTDIVDLPLIEDWEGIAAMKILNIVYVNAFFYPPYYKHGVLVALRMVQISVQQGLCAVSSMAFASFAHFLSISLGSLDEAAYYGNVALQILNRFNTKEWVARVYGLVHTGVTAVISPPEEVLELLWHGHRMGLVTGDFEFSMLLLHVFAAFSLILYCKDLLDLGKNNVTYMAMMSDRKQYSALSLQKPCAQCVSNLLGEADSPTILTGRYMTEAEEIKEYSGEHANGSGLAVVLTLRGYLECLFHEFEKSEKTFKEIEWQFVLLGGQAFIFFCYGVTSLVLARQCSRGLQRRRRKRRGEQLLVRFRKIASASPFLMHRVFLLEALAASCDRSDLAFTKFDASIHWARRFNSIGDEAVATEHAGMARYEKGREMEGKRFMVEAAQLYRKWGAEAKVRQLQRKYNINIEALGNMD